MKTPFAILGTDADDAEIDDFVAALRGEEKRYDPDQPRDPKGSHTGGHWTSGVSPTYGGPFKPAEGDVATDDPTYLENLPAEYRARLLARLKETFPGMDQAALEANLDAVLQRGLASESASGRDWYSDAHAAAVGIAKEYGFTDEQAIAAIAGMSPQHEWGSNVVTARYVARAIKENPEVRLSVEEAARVRVELTKTGITVGRLDAGDRLDTYGIREQASIIKALGKRSGLKYESGPGTMAGATWSCGLNGIEDGVRAFRGEDPRVFLAGHKVRSFFNNIATPKETRAVTIDTHAISAALGEKVTAADPRMGRIMGGPSNREYGTKGTYAIFADAYRSVAEKYGLSPDQAQAIIWLQWRKEHG